MNRAHYGYKSLRPEDYGIEKIHITMNMASIREFDDKDLLELVKFRELIEVNAENCTQVENEQKKLCQDIKGLDEP